MSGGTAGMDIRLPIGLMFTIVGAVLAIFGVVTQGDAMYTEHSLGYNVNLWWGIVLALFGLSMLALTWWGAQKDKKV
jgi:hypothetical protein